MYLILELISSIHLIHHLERERERERERESESESLEESKQSDSFMAMAGAQMSEKGSAYGSGLTR